MSALFAGANVWVPASASVAEDHPYELAEVLSTDPLKCFLIAGGDFVMPKESEVYLANATTETDNTSLLMISDATLLANTSERFAADEIYTFTGSIVTSVNPCKPLPQLYSEAAMAATLKERHVAKAPEPHIFFTAESAYETLLRGGKDQSIVVSGISGAGKTEAIKYIMKYLVWRSATADASTGGGQGALAEKVMLSNPLFEALGNATTVNNPNSSRFGKFIRLRFEGGSVRGALIDTYLLEKSRLASQQAGERSFHIFYQMLAGADPALLSELCLPPGGMYHLLGGGAQPFAHVGVKATAEDAPPPPTNEQVRASMAADFAETSGAMGALGVDAATVMRVLAGILHLGNVAFEAHSHAGGTVEGCRVTEASAASLEHAARLLGLATLQILLTKRSVQAGGGRRSMYDSPLTPTAAAFTRDALAKRLYDGLFSLTVSKINSELGGDHLASLRGPAPPEAKAAAPSAGWIGLLDVFGFEIFARNGFEQLMVNLANERLQRFFLEAIFQREQSEYTEEELPWVPIVDVPDNSDCIATIEAKPYGVLPLLDEQCRLGERGSDGALCELLNSKNSACIAAVEALGQKGRTTFRPDETFTIRHFVQPVTYTAAEFLERNKDTFYHDIARAVANSSNDYVRSLIDPEKVQTEQMVAIAGSGKSYNTVAIAFTASLAALLDELALTDAGFVRCIKPNASLAPNTFHATMALHQLRTCGMVQAVRMMMAMYGARIAYDDIAASWAAAGNVLPEPLARMEPKELVMSICKVFDVPVHEYAFGKTKLFFRAGQAVGLSAFTREATTTAEATMRSAVLLWKLLMRTRELSVASKVAAWLLRCRTKLHGAAYALEKQRLYVHAQAAAAAERAGGGLTSSGVASDSADVSGQYVEAMALHYRSLRRAHAVHCVQTRAVIRIQKHWRAIQGRKITADWRAELKIRAAALKVTAAARGRAGRKKYAAAQEANRATAAAVSVQSATRGLLGRRRYKDEHEAWIAKVTPAAKYIQAAWRATAPRRYRRCAIAAAVLIQCTFRMFRIRRLHQRLMQAIIFLKRGGKLSKYRANHIIGERHDRFVRLTADLGTLQWLPIGKDETEPDPNEKLKEISMTDIQAVSEGAKTGLMKKMYQRAGAGGSIFEKMIGMRPYDLELSRAFSIIVKERTVDFVASNATERDTWLQHLNILLVHQRSFDTEKVITRKDVVEELHMMSFEIGKLLKQRARASERVVRAAKFLAADKRSLERVTESHEAIDVSSP